MSPDPANTSSFFLHKLLKSDSARRQLVARGKTGTMTTIGQDDVASVQLHLPTLPEQQKIASFLGAVDDKIDALRRKHDGLKQFKSGLMQKLFSQELRFKRDDGSDFPDWEEKRLGELMEITSASRVHRADWKQAGVPFYRSSDVVAAYKGAQNKKAFISYELFNELSAKSGRPQKNDILVTGGGSIGIPFLVKSDDPLYFKDADLLWFKGSKCLCGPFLFAFFLCAIFRRYLKSITHVGTIAHYTIEQAKATPIRLPSFAEQQKIADCLSAVDAKIEAVGGQIIQLEAFKKGLFQKMFV